MYHDDQKTNVAPNGRTVKEYDLRDWCRMMGCTPEELTAGKDVTKSEEKLTDFL